ncbi:MAG: anhydro-N-acetylmuramic acid kinase [Campylobacterales bacterium]|nr:anhydro-N-acetylmuramic acid kinase [Campylobacterales bacterium]
MSELYIGVMSGTSLDGIDVALCEIDAHSCKLVASQSSPLPPKLKAMILHAINSKITLEEFTKLDHLLGLAFAKSIDALLKSTSYEKGDIKAIGLHGQTLWHTPKSATPSSLQLGDANVVAVQSKIDVVSDFRRKDVALGGEGAPLAPAFHAFLFQDIIDETAVVNIGGMSNITVKDNSKLIGYDVGCGNVLLDMWIGIQQDKSYDESGAWAKSGKMIQSLLDTMLSDVYFAKSYPKSTGREYFNQEWLEDKLFCHSELVLESKNREILKRVQDDNRESKKEEILKRVQDDKRLQADIQRTLLELTALSIAKEVKRFDKKRVMLCGGGAKNSFLVERLRVNLPQVKVEIAQNSDILEAMAFAWLASMRVYGKSVELSSVTGAKKDAILGAIYAGD